MKNNEKTLKIQLAVQFYVIRSTPAPSSRTVGREKLTLIHLLSFSSISFCDLVYFICKLGFLSIQTHATSHSHDQRQLTAALMTEEVLYFRGFSLIHADTRPVIPDIARVTCSRRYASRHDDTLESHSIIHHKRRTVT